MSDKNKTPEEDYLDSLLRSIMDGNEEEGQLLDDNFITEGDTSEDAFLSDFEKEFFGGDIEKKQDEILDETEEIPETETDILKEEAVKQEEASFDEVASEPDISLDETTLGADIPLDETTSGADITLDETKQGVDVSLNETTLGADISFDDATSASDISFDEAVSGTGISLDEVATESENSLEDAVEQKEFSFDDEIASSVVEKQPEFDLADAIENVSEEQAMVEEAIANEDSNVEADLQGLYGILGMGDEGTSLPEGIEDTPNKKKKYKQAKKAEKERKKQEKKAEKERKKEEKKKNKKKKDLESEIANTIVVEGEGIEDFDFSDISLDSLGIGQSQETTTESPFGMAGLDDSIFDGMSDEGGVQEPIVFDGDPFGDEQFDDEEIDEEAELKAKKKQEKKEAKEKKKKEKEQAKKEKAEAKKKKPKKVKEPKPKKLKEPDEVIKISGIFIVFALSFVIIVVLAAKIGGEYYMYNERFYKAVSLYVYGNDLKEGETLDKEAYESKFSDAYNLIYGLKMKEKDHQVFHDQLVTIEYMDCHYQAYKSFMMMDDYAHGLDSLCKAIKMYDKYQNEARDLKCFDEMTVILSWVDRELNATYGITQSEARELSMIKDDDDYAVRVRAIAAVADEKFNKNKVDEE